MRYLIAALVPFVSAALMNETAAAGPALLFEASTGKILYSESMDNQWHPASLTKIMTAYLVFEDLKAGKIKLDTKITCTERAYQEPPSKVGLPVGAELTIDTALKSLIVKSANDVAVMLAEELGPTYDQFINRMNTTAKRLGMTRTHFNNPNGLPDDAQVTTARDLAKLSRAIVTEFPEYSAYWSMSAFQLGKQRLGSHNGLLNTFEGADGLKTGFICDSGFNVVASATRDGRKLMAVVLGEPSGKDRTIRAASLLEHGFRHYGWKELFNTTSIDNMPIAADAEGVHSVRHTVTAWTCGNRAQARKLRAAKVKVKQARAAQRAKPVQASVPPPAKAASVAN
ncbi:Serine-type D-Ala-D-Ala carboxypeptidase [Candidatus Filomicrobium marinum]|uniref:Serine-type D-Ala-D-Ala carboxypeptidase n=1 Tax=Candidatus Filomicrobium marinum TaxID=1608628 RepID=A0A0D6JDH8_9HYPH|nr:MULTISPECIES: D-alanyl-D-alanine carboxypeptidase family protein [Filomicrobium]MCV0368226.1 D-alanyl-D-alanine carboxypeptidase [Filomicrobium sp.]CFX13746.1 Serine-type D-Ala-D-Ala carboxypeptidase [Candidatus Filomicrobium marinum]CPR17659.1 Serine-type D-Ala-D-Ala carboxypeptidase [Candidatus Filomicrobium marinum]